ncbi:ABC1 family-domain-containing protein, partial [Jimgerdemannia flammicorona]
MPSILPLCSATPFRALFPNTLTLHSRPQPNFLLHPTCDSAFFTAAVRRRRPFRLPPRFAFLLPRHFAFSHPRRIITATSLTTLALASATAYYTYDPFRHFCSAVVRCSRAGWVGAAIAVDYKWSLRESRVFASEEEKKKVKSDVHKRSAEKVYEALVKSGGIYIKLGQHVSAMAYLLPIEWTSTMRPLQDRCPPTPLPAIEQLILTDIGSPLSTLFSDFDPNPIGVASLAQVHRATLRATGQPVAVKIQHPYLDDYAAVDMKTVEVIIGITTRLFPEFGFGWLSEEMNESLPVEMDFECEARNAERVRTNFKKDIEKGRTTLRIPKIVWAKRRVLCME